MITFACFLSQAKGLNGERNHTGFLLPTEGYDSPVTKWLEKEVHLPPGFFQLPATEHRDGNFISKKGNFNCMFSWRFTKMAGLISQGNLFPPVTEYGDCLLADRERGFILSPLGVQEEPGAGSYCLGNERTRFLLWFVLSSLGSPESLTPSVLAPHLSWVDDGPCSWQAGRGTSIPSAGWSLCCSPLSGLLWKVCKLLMAALASVASRGGWAQASGKPHRCSRSVTLKHPSPSIPRPPVRCTLGSRAGLW